MANLSDFFHSLSSFFYDIQRTKERQFNFLIYGAIVSVVSVFIFILVQIKFESLDDLMLLQQAITYSSRELLVTPFLFDDSLFFRPIISLVTKIVFQIAGVYTPAYRLVQVCLLLLLILQVIMLCKQYDVKPMAQAIGIFYIISSPFTFTFFHWWSDLGSLLIVNCFLATLLFVSKEPKDTWINIVCFFTVIFLSLFSKELGLIIPIIFLFYFLAQKNYKKVALVILIAFVYFGLRFSVFGALFPNDEFSASSGFLTNYYSTDELRNKFGHQPYIFFAYNILVQVLSLLTSLPVNGQFLMPNIYSLIVFCLLFSATLVVIFYLLKTPKKSFIHKLLLVAIILNVILSYNYSRARVLAVAGIAYSILLIFASDFLLREKDFQKKAFTNLVALVIFTGFLGYSVLSIRTLSQVSHRNIASFGDSHPSEYVDPQLYELYKERNIHHFSDE